MKIASAWSTLENAQEAANEAYEKLIQWAKNPIYIRQRGFPDKWFYEGARNRWIKPIVPRKNRRSPGAG